jgi:hypothetical protein
MYFRHSLKFHSVIKKRRNRLLKVNKIKKNHKVHQYETIPQFQIRQATLATFWFVNPNSKSINKKNIS